MFLMFCLPAGRAANRNKETKPADPGPALPQRGGVSALQGVGVEVGAWLQLLANSLVGYQTC